MALAEIFGRKIYYELHEPAGGGSKAPPLVLVMGMAGACAGWLALQVPEFVKSRRVLIFDHRGIGESEDTGEPFTTADLAMDAAALVRALGLGPVDVLGAFMGGMVAQEWALSDPELIRKLVLVGTYAKPDAKRRLLLQHWAHMVKQGTPLSSMVYDRLLWTLQDETLEQEDLIESMTRFYTEGGTPFTDELLVRQCDACIAHDASDRLGALPHDTMIVCGRHDQLTPPKFHRELADLVPHSQLVTLSYGAHLVMAESAERFNHVVLQFLDDAR